MAETTGRLHLKPRHRAMIEALLKKHLPGVEVWAYGSRVNGRSHDGSDLDLVLRAPDLARIDTSRVIDFTEALRDSTIPFLVEARDWAGLPESFHREIERDHVVLAGGSDRRRRARGEAPAAPATIDYDKLRQSLKDLEAQYVNYRNPAVLRSALDQEAVAESVIQRFETCYDCLWKVLKRHLIDALGVADPPNSPKPIFRLAHQNHLFRAPVEQWLLYADKRNDTAHDYDCEKAKASLDVMADFIDDAIGLYQTMSGEPWE